MGNNVVPGGRATGERLAGQTRTGRRGHLGMGEPRTRSEMSAAGKLVWQPVRTEGQESEDEDSDSQLQSHTSTGPMFWIL